MSDTVQSSVVSSSKNEDIPCTNKLVKNCCNLCLCKIIIERFVMSNQFRRYLKAVLKNPLVVAFSQENEDE